MPFIIRGEPDKLPGYLTAPLSPSALDKVRADFALGAHDRWDPQVKLVVDERTDLYGKTPEQVMQTLEAENGPKPETFVVIDQDAETNASVWLCAGWADREDYPEKDYQDKLPFLNRVRTSTVGTPLNFVNIDIVNITIPEMEAAYRGNPSVPYEIEDCGGIDFAKEKPPVAYVTAFPGEYEYSDAPEHIGRFYPKPERVIRLKEDVAKQLELMQNWTVGWETPKDGQGAMSFAAERVWNPET